MTIEEFKNEVLEYYFTEISEYKEEFVSIVENPFGSDGIDYIRLDDSTIVYRINTAYDTGDWEVKSNLDDEEEFNSFIAHLIDVLS